MSHISFSLLSARFSLCSTTSFRKPSSQCKHYARKPAPANVSVTLSYVCEWVCACVSWTSSWSTLIPPPPPSRGSFDPAGLTQHPCCICLIVLQHALHDARSDSRRFYCGTFHTPSPPPHFCFSLFIFLLFSLCSRRADRSRLLFWRKSNFKMVRALPPVPLYIVSSNPRKRPHVVFAG